MKRVIQSARINVWIYFAATYAISWLLWLPAILWPDDEPNLLLLVLGASAPSAVGVVFVYLSQDRAAWRRFWLRAVSLRRIGWRWLVVIVLLFPVVFGLALLLYKFVGGDPPPLAPVGERLVNPGTMLQLVFANLVVSGFSEELGWRGYALDRLQARWSALTASLILGAVHGLWHIPLFFIPGITQGEMGLFSTGAVVFLLGGPAMAVIFTWIYNNTRGSVLSAILVHAMANLCLDLLAGLQGTLPTGYFVMYTAVLIAFDILIVTVWGPRTFTRRHRQAATRQLIAQ